MAVLKGLCSVNFGAPGSGHVASPWLWHSGYPVKLSFSGVARVAVCVSRVSHYYAKHPPTAANLGNQCGDDLSGGGPGVFTLRTGRGQSPQPKPAVAIDDKDG